MVHTSHSSANNVSLMRRMGGSLDFYHNESWAPSTELMLLSSSQPEQEPEVAMFLSNLMNQMRPTLRKKLLLKKKKKKRKRNRKPKKNQQNPRLRKQKKKRVKLRVSISKSCLSTFSHISSGFALSQPFDSQAQMLTNKSEEEEKEEAKEEEEEKVEVEEEKGDEGAEVEDGGDKDAEESAEADAAGEDEEEKEDEKTEEEESKEEESKDESKEEDKVDGAEEEQKDEDKKDEAEDEKTKDETKEDVKKEDKKKEEVKETKEDAHEDEKTKDETKEDVKKEDKKKEEVKETKEDAHEDEKKKDEKREEVKETKEDAHEDEKDEKKEDKEETKEDAHEDEKDEKKEDKGDKEETKDEAHAEPAAEEKAGKTEEHDELEDGDDKVNGHAEKDDDTKVDGDDDKGEDKVDGHGRSLKEVVDSQERSPAKSSSAPHAAVVTKTITKTIVQSVPKLIGGGWTLLFKAVSETGGPVFSHWETEGKTNEPTGEPVRLDVADPYRYKSSIIDNWEQYSIQEVKVVLYKDNEEVLVLRFDAEGTNKSDWYSQDRLIESPFIDLSPDKKANGFSFQGQRDGKIARTMFIDGGVDHGWFVVIDKPDNAPWAKKAAVPHFLYSTTDQCVNWNDAADVGQADVLAIFALGFGANDEDEED
uniref:Uncharacterized protein n=1 Tax=Branchiostoma floridae TaxID=7739 RepID=C3Z9Y0_BRAFL|eukprot:XP_002594557.1 hypothetical protein BRAFLDRAFT_77525 [Branchiostoma floridae]